MNSNPSFKVQKLVLVFKKTTEVIDFSRVSYFYGQMGAGKSSIARLIDYCLGGSLDLSSALQSEFVSAILLLNINGKEVSLERPRDSNQVHASWFEGEEQSDIIIPCRTPAGIVIPDTEIEVLSDLLFHLLGIVPPKVRRSKITESAELVRLSFRDFLWYCYLDQDHIDSNFFNLDEGSMPYKKYKSRDVLRFLLGFHQQLVAELESRLRFIWLRKSELIAAAKALEEALLDADVASEKEIEDRVVALKRESVIIQVRLADLRTNKLEIPHGVDQLRHKARELTYEVQSLEEAIQDVAGTIEQDQRHKNEIRMLGIKVKRVAAARAVLSGVSFTACPRCAQDLPEREINHCPVCAQEEPIGGKENLDSEVVEEDAKSRISELTDSIELQEKQLGLMRRRLDELESDRKKINDELTTQMAQFDSAYLSNALVHEKRRAEIDQQVQNLSKLIKLPQKVKSILAQVDKLAERESKTRRELEEARKGAEADLSNIQLLEELFKDCLLRSRVPGIAADNTVNISPKDLLPEVLQPSTGETITTSFSNLMSGGKKTLFKVCYALAIHRLAKSIGALLPAFLIIDSPMKNISERENSEQFEGLYQLIYELAVGELSDTQFIIIDKEHYLPNNIDFEITTRHMMPNSLEFPPLIPYYRGN